MRPIINRGVLGIASFIRAVCSCVYPRSWQIGLQSAVVAVVMMGLGGLYWLGLEYRRIDRLFKAESQALAQVIETRVAHNEAVLHGLTALFEAQDSFSDPNFRRYALTMLRRYPQLYAVEFVSRVELSQRKAFEQRLSQKYAHPVEIRVFDHANKRVWSRAISRPYYYPVTAIMPLTVSNQAVLGLDLDASPLFEKVLRQALVSGNIQTSPAFDLYEGGRAYLIVKSIVANRADRSEGMLAVVVNAPAMLQPSAPPALIASIRLRYRDAQTESQADVASLQLQAAPLFSILPTLSWAQSIAVGEQSWVFETRYPIRFEVLNWAGSLWAVVWGLLCGGGVFAVLRRSRPTVVPPVSPPPVAALSHAEMTLAAVGDGVMTFGASKRIESLNPRACQWLKRPESAWLGQPVEHVVRLQEDFSQSQGLPPFERCLRQGVTIEFFEANAALIPQQGEGLAIEGCLAPLRDAQGQILGGVLTFRPVVQARQNERRALEIREKYLRDHGAQLAHVARIHTMGEMASGIAHEINQPLSAILSYSQAASRLLQEEDPDLPTILHALQSTAMQANRAGEIIRRLRAFVAKREVETHDVSLNAVAESVCLLAEYDLRQHEVQLELRLQPDLPLVEADSIQLEQVVLNLVRNAMEATAFRRPFGQIVIETFHANHQVYMVVQDNGCGFTEEGLNRVFEPFFSTKSEGMGLGLTICQSIIESFSGRLSAGNHPEGGARFEIQLPMIYLPDAEPSSPNSLAAHEIKGS